MKGDFVLVDFLGEANHAVRDALKAWLARHQASDSATGRAWAWRGDYRRYDRWVSELTGILDSHSIDVDRGYLALVSSPRTWCGSCAEPYFGKLWTTITRSAVRDGNAPIAFGEAHRLARIERQAKGWLASDEELAKEQAAPKLDADEMKRRLTEAGATVRLKGE